MEPVWYEHSWDAPHRLTNMVLFKLQRHGDHHVNSTRRYQILRAEPSRSPQVRCDDADSWGRLIFVGRVQWLRRFSDCVRRGRSSSLTGPILFSLTLPYATVVMRSSLYEGSTISAWWASTFTVPKLVRSLALRFAASLCDQLPMGYSACILLALCPPLWRAVMNPRVLRLRSKYKGREWRHGPGA